MTFDEFLEWTVEASKNRPRFLREFPRKLFALFRDRERERRQLVPGSRLAAGRKHGTFQTGLNSMKKRLTKKSDRA